MAREPMVTRTILGTEVNAIIAELMADGTLDALAEKYELTLVK